MKFVWEISWILVCDMELDCVAVLGSKWGCCLIFVRFILLVVMFLLKPLKLILWFVGSGVSLAEDVIYIYEREFHLGF